MAFESVLPGLHAISPYEGLDPEQYPNDLQGWGSDDPIFREIIGLLRPEIIVEVGTWKGASAIHMADIVRELGLSTTIVCVDTWLGSPEHYLQAGLGDGLRPKHGYPQLYFTFLANVVRSGHAGRIIPLPMTSESAAVILAAKGVRPDLVYVDAAHERDPALRDFRAYWGLMAGSGVLIGDDYLSWPGVTAAARCFIKEVGLPYYRKYSKFAVSANPVVVTDKRRIAGPPCRQVRQ